jgi:hypothetical protein
MVEMPMQRWFIVLSLVIACFVPSSASAAGFFGPHPDYAPSVFTYGYRGLLTGGVTGLAAGYLVARHDGFSHDDWRPLVLGSGIGALSGSVLGLTLGFVDLSDDQPGMASIALRDTLYGAGFGALLGTITGGLVIIRTHDAEHLLFGAALGTVTGAGLGLVIGLIEGRRIVTSPQHRYMGSLGATRDSAGNLVWTPQVQLAF